jgi:hypothetical protein
VLVAGGVTLAVLRPDEPPAGTAVTPTASATPTPTPTPTPTRSAAPKPAKPTNPLTGRAPSDHGVFAVKVENIAAARPQAGLGAADIVFVEEVEASLTRLVAVYHTDLPRRVGPVRSARNTDVELLPLFGKPGLVYSGANRRVQRRIDRASITPLPRSTRDPSRVAPHNVFVDLAAIARSAKVRKPGDIGWTFAGSDHRWAAAAKDDRPAGRVGADRMSFDYRGGRYVVRWQGRTYDERAGAVRTDNVVVLRTRTRPDGNADVNGVRSVKSETVGRGSVIVYRDGRRLSGTWQRRSTGAPMRLVDADGRDIPLRPGKTWVLLSR